MNNRHKLTAFLDKDDYKLFHALVGSDHFDSDRKVSDKRGRYITDELIEPWLEFRRALQDSYGIDYIRLKDILEWAQSEPQVLLQMVEDKIAEESTVIETEQ